MINARYTFRLKTRRQHAELPDSIVLGLNEDRTEEQLLLTCLSYLLLFRERLEVNARPPDDNLRYIPDVVQLDYQLRPVLWVECGEVTVEKLDRVAVKAPEAELWIARPSVAAAETLFDQMAKKKLRRNRYHLIGFEQEVVAELLGLLQPRNDIFWMESQFHPPSLQFEFNELWFDTSFTVFEF